MQVTRRTKRRLRLEALERRVLMAGVTPTLDITGDGVYMNYLVGDKHEITFTATDPDSEATVSFFYDTDQNPANGNMPIVSDLPVTGGGGQKYAWTTTDVEPGLYYIYGVATDGENSTSDWWAGALVMSSPAGNPLATFQTSEGTFSIVLSQWTNPITVANFRNYAQAGFYDDLIFHRVISNFMVQGGGYYDNLTSPTTNPPIYNENLVNQDQSLSNYAGTISMARTADPNSATSQFYVNVVNNGVQYDAGGNVVSYGLDYQNDSAPGYCAFGQVISGMEYVNQIRYTPTHYENASFQDLPDTPVYIDSVTITDPAVPAGDVWVVIGDDASKSLSFVDEDGTEVSVSLKGGTAQVHLVGDDLQPVFDNKGTTVVGTNIACDEIVLSGTTDKSALTIKGKGGDDLVEVGEITGILAAGKLSAKNTDLVGAGIVMSGDGIFSSVDVHDFMNGADIIMPGAYDSGVTFKVGQFGPGSDVVLDDAGVKSLTAASWAGSGLEAVWAGKVAIKGDLGADITITGADASGMSLKSLSVSGSILDAAITLAEDCGGVTAAEWLGGSLTGSYLKGVTTKGNSKEGIDGDLDAALDVAELGKLNVKGELNGALTVDTGVSSIAAASIGAGWTADVGNEIGKLSVKGNVGDSNSVDGVNVTALSAKSISIKGDMEHTQLRFTQNVADRIYALNKLSVSGLLLDVSLRTVGHINSVTVGAIESSEVLAGVDDAVSGMPQDTADFTRQATISKFTVKGIKDDVFSTLDTDIAAWDLGKIKLTDVQYDNGGVNFGLTYRTLSSLQIKAPDGSYKWPNKDEPVQPSNNQDLTIIVV